MHSHLHGHPALAHAVKRLEHLNPDQFELYFEHKTVTKIDSKDQQVDSLSRAEDVGLAVRLVKDRRIGFSFTTSLEKPAIERAVDAAMEVAKHMPEDPYVGLYSFGSEAYPNVDNYDVKGLEKPVAEKIAMAKELESLCRATDKRITGIRSATVSEHSYRVHLIDSNGEQIEHQSTMYSGSITCKAEQDGEAQVGSEYGFSNYFDNLDIKSVARVAAQEATELLGAGTAPTLVCPAVFRNSVMAELIEFLSSSFSAEQIDKGRSMLADKMGSPLFSEKVTLIDDGLLPGGYATSPFDGEGIPSSKTLLVDGGFISGTLNDGYYARKRGVEPTGNSQRGIKSPPSIGFNNLYMPGGKRTSAELMDGISKGILITHLMGVHTANPVTGDFSLGASGILIEGGKLSKPVRGFAVAGNVIELFRRITDLGSDLKFFGNVGAPSARISEISVGGA